MDGIARILIVDADTAALDALARPLADAGHKVLRADTGRQGLETMHAERPELVLLSLDLPDCTAPELLQGVRAEPAFAAVAIVLVGAITTTDERRDAGLDAGLDAGADGYIMRPVSNHELLWRVRMHLRQRELARNLLEKEQQCRDIVEHLPDMVFISRDERVTYINPAGLAMLRADCEAQIVGRSPLEFFSADDRETLCAEMAKLHRQRMSMPLAVEKLLPLDDTPLDVEVLATSFPNGQHMDIQVIVRDISERKRLEAEHEQLLLRERAGHERLITMLESIGEGFMALDSDWRINYLNKEAESLLKCRRSEVIGEDLWTAFADNIGAAFKPEHRRALQDDVAISLVQNYPALDAWIDMRAYPSPEGLAIYLRDVTLERSLEERTRHSQRLESVGQLTGGVAHDFNNLLTVILGNAEILDEQLNGQQTLQSLAQMIAGAARRGATLTRSLLAFAQRQPLEPKPINVNELVIGMQGLLHRTLGEDIEITLNLAADLDPTLVDYAQLENALLNICLNAREAMPEGGQLTIETSHCEFDSSFTEQALKLDPGKYIVVSVTDTGCGIPEEYLSRVFEPFFSTKGKGKGAGLGLSMVYGFIKQSGGQLNLNSVTGKGTTLRMYLPRALAANAPAHKPIVYDAVAGGGETILLAEDDDMVRRYAQHQLAALGYKVIAAATGPEALEIIRQRDDVDLLFTDIVMPGGMNGRQLAEAAQAIHPELKVLYTSGYSENAVTHDGRLDTGVQLLSKPYRRVELAARIRAMLDTK